MSVRLVSIVLVWCLYAVDSCPECMGSNSDYDNAWKAYKVDHDKTYEKCSEECNRRLIWEDRCKFFDEFNRRPPSNDTRYHIALNKFADWTDDELSYTLLGTVVPQDVVFDNPVWTDLPLRSPPTYFDYTDHGYVTSVKAQGNCGNCWAFATAGAVEGQLYKACGHLIDVSIQQINDCCNDDKYSSHGCNGGWMTGAFQCIKDIGGIVTSDVYTLQRVDQDCGIPEAKNTRYVCDGYANIKSFDEASLMQYLLNVGPIACTMYASPLTFILYDRGIYTDKNCNEKLDHAVLLTGCGTTSDGLNYWIFKNSWGRNWGEGGYFRIIRDRNLCDISHYCSYPVNCNVVSVETPNE